MSRKYYLPTLCTDVEAYIRECDVCLASMTVGHKPYGDPQSLLVPIHGWKDLLINFVIGHPISANWKGDSYDVILVILYRLTKMVHYERVKTNIDATGFAEVIINILVKHHGLLELVIIETGSLFISKFCSSLCYLFGIKLKVSTTLHP